MKDSNTFLVETLRSLTSIPSPSGRTEQIVGWTVELLQSWSFEPDLTRRGAIKLKLQGKDSSRVHALTAHLVRWEEWCGISKTMADVRWLLAELVPAASQRVPE